MTQVPIIVVADPDTPGCADVKVDIEVDGRRYRCELDTGAARTTLASDEYLASLPACGSDRSARAFSARTDDLVTILGLAVGPLSVGPVEVARVPAGPDQRCLLGMDVLGRYCCRFRFDAGILELTDSPDPAATLPLQVSDRGHLYVTPRWAGISASACWDSGAGITLVDQSFHRAHPHLFAEAGTTVGRDGSGASFETPVYLMSGPMIGGVQFGPSLAAVIDMSAMNHGLQYPMDMIVGYPTYRQAEWLFDVPGRGWQAPRLMAQPG
jgi:Aspartyl protease